MRDSEHGAHAASLGGPLPLADFRIQNKSLPKLRPGSDSPALPRARRDQQRLLASQGANVLVAVIDSGINVSDPLLAARLWRNPGDLADGIDNDQDGRIDDITGWDFVANDALASDEHGHGSAMATLILRQATQAQLMPLRVADHEGLATAGAIAEAINYAVRHGARVINLSLSSRQGDPSVKAALQEALRQGVTVIAAAGNEGGNRPLFPANVPGVIAAGITRKNGKKPSWANGDRGKEKEFIGIVNASTKSSGQGNFSGSSAAAATLSGCAAAILGTTKRLPTIRELNQLTAKKMAGRAQA